jgi:hypothetical protein
VVGDAKRSNELGIASGSGRLGGWIRDDPLSRHSRPSIKSTSHIVATATDLPQISFDNYARYMISDAHVIANA